MKEEEIEATAEKALRVYSWFTAFVKFFKKNWWILVMIVFLWVLYLYFDKVKVNKELKYKIQIEKIEKEMEIRQDLFNEFNKSDARIKEDLREIRTLLQN